MIALRINFILFVLSGLLILNYGFMQVRIGPIPLAELALMLFLATANIPLVLKRFSQTLNSLPFILWWLVGITSALYYLNINGIWALRDATNIIESFFILVGFSLFSFDKYRNHIINNYHKYLLVLCVYGLSYPFGSYLQELSPKITAGAGHTVAIFFSHTNSAMMLLIGALFLVNNPVGNGFFQKNGKLIAAMLLLFTVAMFQARTIYLQIITLIIILLFIKPSAAKHWLFVLLGSLVLLTVLSTLGIELQGRLGQTLSIEFLSNHFMAIFGVESDGLEGAAKGVGQRLDWWLDIYSRWSNDISTVLFGLGFGFPLIDFGIAHGVIVREPHNSYISVLARTGLVGFTFWVWMHICLLKAWLFSYRTCKQVNWKTGERLLVIFISYFALIWCLAIGEDGFEKPYNTVPYYFFWGIVIRIAWFAKQNMIGSRGVINK